MSDAGKERQQQQQQDTQLDAAALQDGLASQTSGSMPGEVPQALQLVGSRGPAHGPTVVEAVVQPSSLRNASAGMGAGATTPAPGIDGVHVGIAAKAASSSASEDGHTKVIIKHMATEAQTEEQWIYYRPYLSITTVIMLFFAMMLIWCFGWLYVGATWNPNQYISKFDVGVLNCDAGLNTSGLQPPALGYLLQQPLASSLLYSAIWNPASPGHGALSWFNFSCPGCGSSPQAEQACYDQLLQASNNGDAWAYLFFPLNTSATFAAWYPNNTAVALPTGGFPLPPVVKFVYGRGRSYSTYSFLAVVVQAIATQMSLSLGRSVASTPALIAAVNTTYLLQPLVLQTVDLHPVPMFGQNLATYVICILMWLGASFAAALSHQFKTPIERRALNTTGAMRPSKAMVLFRVILVKGSSCYLFLFVLSVLVHCIIFACGMGTEVFNYNPGYSIAYAWYMSWSFFAINAFLLHLLGPERFTSLSAFLMILQLMSCGGIIDNQMSNPFFQIGYGLPFYYGVRGLRTIFFGGLENLMYINWLVLTAWNLLISIPTIWFVLHRVYTSGERSRPTYIPISVVNDAAASWGL